MEPVLTALLPMIERALDDPNIPWWKKQRLREARNEIRHVLAELRDLDNPRPPIHARICRIMILLAEGGLFSSVKKRLATFRVASLVYSPRFDGGSFRAICSTGP